MGLSVERDLSDMAVIGRIVSILGDKARVDLGGVEVEDIVVSLVEAKVGDYVLIHRGYVIKVLTEEELGRDLRKILEELGV